LLNKDVKLTLRISEEDINEIDNFLNSYPEFGSRSEFIRHAVMSYIASKRVSVLKDPNQSAFELDLDDNTANIIKTVIDKGFFKSEKDLISAVVREYVDVFLLDFVKRKSKNMKDLMGELSSFEGVKHSTIERRNGR